MTTNRSTASLALVLALFLCLGCAQRPVAQRPLTAPTAATFDEAYQPPAEVCFEDDFAREASDPDPWEADSRVWRVDAFRDARLSTNPHVYVVRHRGPEWSTARIDRPRWRDYRVTVAVKLTKAEDDARVALAAYHGSTGSYRLVLAPSEGKVWLERVESDTESSTLARAAVNIAQDTWYLATLEVADGVLRGSIDGREIVVARDDALESGGVALLVAGSVTAHFDDVATSTVRVVVSDFEGSRPCSGWQRVSGQWLVYPVGSEAQGHDLGLDPNGGTGLVLTGEASWRNCRVSALARIEPMATSAAPCAGIVLNAVASGDHYRFDCAPDGSSRLVLVSAGKEAILARGTNAAWNGGAIRLEARTDDGIIRCLIDGTQVLEAAEATIASGRAGLWAAGPSVVRFDDVVVRAAGNPRRGKAINPVFVAQEDMASWARESSAWKTFTGGVNWHNGCFDGDVTVTLVPRERGGDCRIVMAPDTGATDRYVLAWHGRDDTLAFERAASRVGSATLKGVKPSRLSLRRFGPHLVGLVDDVPRLAWTDDTPLRTCRVGFAGGVQEAGVEAPYLRDYTLTSAPTDWRPHSGEWGVTQRWACDPRWSFFGGRSRKVAAIWTKESFSPDVKVEVWCAPGTHVQDYKAGPSWWLEGAYQYDHPSDLNVTIAGGGGAPDSEGYAFVFNGWNRTANRILRNGRTVAESTEYLLSTKNVYDRAYNHHWFHIVVESSDGQLTFTVDGRKLLECAAPEPVDAGHVALWTRNNRLLVGRVRIYSLPEDRLALPSGSRSP